MIYLNVIHAYTTEILHVRILYVLYMILSLVFLRSKQNTV